MRKRIPYRVCRCLPNGVVTHLEARMLREMVNREIHPIRCAASCRRMYLKGSRIGDLCAETGHFYWAMKVWRFTSRLIEDKDFEDWRYVWFDNDRVRLRDVISEREVELLDRRVSDLWRHLGFPEYAWYDADYERLARDTFGFSYMDLWEEKFDYAPYFAHVEWDKLMRELEAEQETERLFQEALGDDFSSDAYLVAA